VGAVALCFFCECYCVFHCRVGFGFGWFLKIKLCHPSSMARPLLRWITLTACLCACVISHPSVGSGESVDFKLADLSGQEYILSDYRGRWVVINFWATWCGPCMKEIPELIRFQNEHHSRVQVFGISFEKTEPKAAQPPGSRQNRLGGPIF